MKPLESLTRLATQYRALQFYAHMAHNLTSGPTFFQDHEFFGELYPAYESAYDGLIERVIGLGGNPDIAETNITAANVLKIANDKNAQEFFARILASEKGIQGMIDEAIKTQTQGTQNFLQGLADDSEVRVYKIQQRLK
mgnify:CR=1 FL=1